MKKSKLVILFILCLILATGCNDKEETSSTSSVTSKDGEITSIEDITSTTGELSCTREGSASDGITPSFNYYIKYENDNIIELHSVEMITSTNQDSLDEYETAYQNINNYYKGLKYYDTEVVRTDNSVTRDTVINYDKIDIKKLLDIEGEEDNIIENGKAKLSIWLEFASQFGTTCTES